MAIRLIKLVSSGLDKPDAAIVFDALHTLVRGPSDTGKSYIRDCLWYCMGGDAAPKAFPEMEGYTLLRLELLSGETTYQIERALAGGGSSVYKLISSQTGERERLDIEEGHLLVELAGAQGRQLLRSASKKGAVTGGDLRHWSLLSQPGMISESPTSGTSRDEIQRISAFNLFLTGSDDASIQITKSQAEVEQIKGKITSAEDALIRVRTGLEPDVTRKDLEDSFERVEATLTAMKTQYESRAATLRNIREEIARTGSAAREMRTQLHHSQSMIERFELLDKKYISDLQRLGATTEGISFFEALDEVPCPLCGTISSGQPDPSQLKPNAPSKYRDALTAESKKISVLRSGLATSLDRERQRLGAVKEQENLLNEELRKLERTESQAVTAARVEFSADPKTLAERHSTLTAQLGILDEIDRLSTEIERLKKQKVRKRVPVNREVGTNAQAVAAFAKQFLHEWGFTDVNLVELDPQECDLRLDGRSRLSFGAGKRAIFLCALIVSLLRHAMEKGFPHLGIAVIDSPLKTYADPQQTDQDIAASTVTENFYNWLANWPGPGQIVILENENISKQTARLLSPIEFTRLNDNGRAGFYPMTITPPRKI